MEWKVRSQLAAVALVSTSLLAGAHMAQAQSVPNGTRCSSSGQYKLAWTIPLRSSDVGARIESVIGRSEFSPVIEPRGATERVTVGRAPDGTLALQMNVSRGENDNVNFRLGQFGDPGVDAVCLSLRVFLESGFKFAPDGGMKMGWGLWGGSKYDSAGGTKPSNQRGWTLRNVNNSRYGFRLYSYHLNRPSQYGEQSGNIGKLIPGRWHTIDLEVVMNTPGRTDGYAQAWLDGGGRRIMDNLQFRKTADWAIRGLMFNDMWGGDVKDRENWSPQNQKMWYADYKLYTRNGSGGALARNNPSTSQSSGAKGSTASPRSGSGDVARLEEDLRIAKNRLRIAKERHARGEIPISNVRNREADVAAARAALRDV